jgi:hypothetical protein
VGGSEHLLLKSPDIFLLTSETRQCPFTAGMT